MVTDEPTAPEISDNPQHTLLGHEVSRPLSQRLLSITLSSIAHAPSTLGWAVFISLATNPFVAITNCSEITSLSEILLGLVHKNLLEQKILVSLQ